MDVQSAVNELPSIAAAPPPRASDRGSVLLTRSAAALRDPISILSVCFALAVVSRLIGLNLAITADEGYWIHRTIRFGAALARGDLASTYRTGHPGVTTMWVGLIGVGPGRLAPFLGSRYIDPIVFEGAPGYLEVLAAARYAVAMTTAALFVLCVALAWRLLGPAPALLGGLLLLLDPYLLGSSRLLHVDALLAPLMTVSMLAGLIYWLRGGRWPYLALSGLAGGLALLTKTPAVYLALYLGLVTLVVARPWRGAARLVPLAAWGVIACLVYFALWPALWVDPVQQLRKVLDFTLSTGGTPHLLSNYFLGNNISTDPGPLYYPVALAFRLGPVTLVSLVALLAGRWAGRAEARPAIWLVAYVILFASFMTLGPKKLDRYMLPAIMVLDLLAGVGLWMLATRLTAHGLRLAVLVAPLALQVALFWQSYPYPLAFYNPLLGGAAGAQRAIMVGWGEGLEQTAAYLNRQPGAEKLVAATLYHHVLRPRFRGSTVPIVEPTQLDYYVLYVNMAQRNLIPVAVQQAMAAGPPEFTAVVQGVEFAWVYRVTGLVQEQPGTAPEPPAEQE